MDFTASGFDLVVISTILLLALFGFLRGFFKEVLSLAGWILAAALSYFLSPFAAEILSKNGSSLALMGLISQTAIFAISLIIIGIINSMILKSLEGIIPGSLDHGLGLTFGFLKGYMIVALIFSAIAAFYSSGLFFDRSDKSSKRSSSRVGPVWLQEARTYELLEYGADLLRPVTDKVMESVVSNISGSAVGKKDRILEKLDSIKELQGDELEGDDPENEMIDSYYEGTGYKTRDLRKLNRLIDIVN